MSALRAAHTSPDLSLNNSNNCCCSLVGGEGDAAEAVTREGREGKNDDENEELDEQQDEEASAFDVDAVSVTDAATALCAADEDAMMLLERQIVGRGNLLSSLCGSSGHKPVLENAPA